jgi:hypothetical protein
MKKAISVMAAAMMLTCTFVSCGSKDKDEDTIVGKWELTEESLKQMNEESDAFYLTAAVEIRKDNTIRYYGEADFSEKVSVGENTVNWGGREVPYTYDGKTIDLGGGQIMFERIGDADESSVYGEYKSDALNDYMELDNIVLNFISSDKTLIIIDQEGTYEYDEKNGTITTSLDDEDEEPSKVELDGDTLKITDDDGEVEIYSRVK